MVQQKIKDRFNNMNADEALKYVFQDSDFSVYQILKFPFGLLASCIYTANIGFSMKLIINL